MKVVSPFYSITFVLANILSLKLERTFSCQTHVMSLPHFHSLDVEIYCFKYVPYFKKIYCENAFFSIISEDSLKLWKTVADIFIFAVYHPDTGFLFLKTQRDCKYTFQAFQENVLLCKHASNLLIISSLNKKCVKLKNMSVNKFQS